MRVLQIHKDFAPLNGGGGTARHIHGLSCALAAMGHEVEVASVSPESFETPFRSSHVPVHALAAPIRWADVVHVHGARSHYAVAGALQAKVLGRPFFYTPHAFYDARTRGKAVVKAAWDQTAERFLIEKSAGLILLTDAWHGFLRERRLSPAKLSIIPNCVLEQELWHPPPRGALPHLPGAPAILSVGRLDPVKRIDDVIRALESHALSNAHLHVVGRGAERPALEALARNLGLADRVTFHGFVDDDGVARMATGCDVFVLASEQEGLPTVLLEMLMARVPVVCTRIAGNLAITSVAGVEATCEVGDVAALSRLLADHGDAGRPDAVEALKRAFTWEQRAPEIAALYDAARGMARADTAKASSRA
jgi:glycosyltransferase involved in cell wall biosynthesis